MGNRLPAPWESRLDRSRTLAFSFTGKQHRGVAGDTIARVLLANGHWVLSRSFKYHRPHGPMSMNGQEANTLVQVGPLPNIQAELAMLQEGIAVTSPSTLGNVNADPGILIDRLGRFMPVGSYYRGFMGPTRNSWLKLLEPLIRKMAGMGKVSIGQQPEHYERLDRHCDVLVIGAGPAGTITGYSAQIDEEALGHGFSVFVSVKLDKQVDKTLAKFEAAIRTFPEVVDCWLMTGNRDYLLRIATNGLAEFERFLVGKFTKLPGVASIESSIPLRRVKTGLARISQPAAASQPAGPAA